MDSLQFSKCNNSGCVEAKAEGDTAVIVLGLLAFGLGVYYIHKHFEYKKEIAFASLPTIYSKVA